MDDSEHSPSILDEHGLLKDVEPLFSLNDVEPPFSLQNAAEAKSAQPEDLPPNTDKRLEPKDRNKRRHNRSHSHDKPERPPKKPRYARETTPAIQSRIRNSEAAIKKLKQHMAKKTCPSTLRYNVRAKIRPDEDFKKDIASIRKLAEQKLLEALTGFHYRNIESNQKQLKKAQQKARKPKKNVVSSVCNRAQSTVKETVERIQQQFAVMKNMMSELNEAQNKESEKYSSCLLTDSLAKRGRATERKRALANKKHNERKKQKKCNRAHQKTEENKRYIKNLSDFEMSTAQISLLSKGLKFIPMPHTDANHTRKQLLCDFEGYARRMRLQYMYHGMTRQIHPFYVRSNWKPPVQPSVASRDLS